MLEIKTSSACISDSDPKEDEKMEPGASSQVGASSQEHVSAPSFEPKSKEQSTEIPSTSAAQRRTTSSLARSHEKHKEGKTCFESVLRDCYFADCSLFFPCKVSHLIIFIHNTRCLRKERFCCRICTRDSFSTGKLACFLFRVLCKHH